MSVMMNKEPQKLAEDLGKIIQGDVFADILHRAAFSTDASIYQVIPVCVVAPRDDKDVAAVVKYAVQEHIPVVARGAASGVAGESLGSGIIFDMTCYMNRIIGFDESSKTVTCQPGVVLDELNNYLNKFGRKIGPDPSSSDRATIGGCVANNATGAHFLSYGYMGDYVEGLEVVLADGNLLKLTNNYNPADGADFVADTIAEKCIALLSDENEIIKQALPKSKRNRSGYNIAGICRDGKIDLAHLMAGSEGTLGVFTKIELSTLPVAKAKGLLQLEFDSLEKMAKAVPIIVDSGASACELMDKILIDMARDAFAQYRDILPADAAATLLVEHTADIQIEVREKIKETDRTVGSLAGARSVFFEPAQQERLWKSRKDAAALLGRARGWKKPVAFIEDTSVENSRLAEYISGLQAISRKFDFSMSFYGHAGDGVLHLRPYLDLRDDTDIEKMKAIAEEVFSLVWSLGGSISGEHADGLVRAGFIKRQYGDKYYQLLVEVKKLFDPEGLMNPGKIISGDSAVLTRNLRAAHKFSPERLESDLLFEKDELAFEIDQCSGCGLCLAKADDLRMCPVFRALGEELGSCRAKANILRFWVTGQLTESDFRSAEFKNFLSLCVNCKACLRQCPAGVDISKIMVAARAEFAKRRGLQPAEKLLSRNRYLSMAAVPFAPLANFLTGLPVFKWFLEKTAALDRRRTMPKFEYGSFVKKGRKYIAGLQPIVNPIEKVAFFIDTYANYNDHELAFAVIDVLRYNNIEVIIPRQLPAPLPAVCYGDVRPARRELEYNTKQLAGAVKAGYKIVCSEPSAALCLREELRHFVSSSDAGCVSENTYELISFLWYLFEQGKLKPAVSSVSGEFVYHNPCHMLALDEGGASVKLLDKLCGIKVAELDAGCCGMAGTFGMQKKNYELSAKIAEPFKKALNACSAEYVLTECAACKMQIEHISEKKVVHPIKILAQSYRLD